MNPAVILLNLVTKASNKKKAPEGAVHHHYQTSRARNKIAKEAERPITRVLKAEALDLRSCFLEAIISEPFS